MAEHEVRADVRGARRGRARAHRVAAVSDGLRAMRWTALSSREPGVLPSRWLPSIAPYVAVARRLVLVLRCDLGNAVAAGAVWRDWFRPSSRTSIFGAPGLLVDQEYGLLPYAPVYVLAVIGFWRMWRAGGESARRRDRNRADLRRADRDRRRFPHLVGWQRLARTSADRPGCCSSRCRSRSPSRQHRRAARGAPRTSRCCRSVVGIAGVMLLAQNGMLIWPTTVTGRRRCSNICRRAGRVEQRAVVHLPRGTDCAGGNGDLARVRGDRRDRVDADSLRTSQAGTASLVALAIGAA